MASAEYHWVLERGSWENETQHILFLKQKKAYEYAATHVSGKHVLDYGVGSDFGTLLLSQHASRVVGVDVFPKTIAFCKKFHRKPNTKFIRIRDSYTTPFPDNHFDVVTSFQVIEHIKDVERYLRELHRVLKPGGTIIITTPNKEYRLLPFQKPWNDDHLREYSKQGLQKEMQAVFPKAEILAVSGTPEVVAIEHARVKQSPVHVYILNPAKRIIKRLAPRAVRRISQKSDTGLAHAEQYYVPTYTTDDFCVQDDTSMALDWVARAEK